MYSESNLESKAIFLSASIQDYDLLAGLEIPEQRVSWSNSILDLSSADLIVIDGSHLLKNGPLSFERKKRDECFFPVVCLYRTEQHAVVNQFNFDEHIPIPVSRPVLIQRIKSLLERRALSVRNRVLRLQLHEKVAQLQNLNQKLETRTEDAEQANSTKSSFLANMSHEIRTPLAIMIGYAQILKDNKVTSVDQSAYLDTIIRNGKSLTAIIDDILDLSKVEAGKIEIEQIEFSLEQLIADAIDMFRAKALDKNLELGFRLDPDVPRICISDPTKIRQVVVNLLSNALKFTKVGSIRIVVSSRLQNDAHEFEVDVIDSGIGITPDQREKLFEPFVQANASTTREFGGTGLGLALSRKIARALGGDLRIDEKYDSGSRFIFKFPCYPTSFSEPKFKIETKPKRIDSRLKSLKILIVDDSSDNQNLLSLFLKNSVKQIEFANNGEAGIEKALAEKYDCVLMDIQMPVLNGYQAIVKLRDFGYQQPVVALSAHAMKEEIEKAKNLGFDAYLTKPVDKAKLLATIELLTSHD